MHEAQRHLPPSAPCLWLCQRDLSQADCSRSRPRPQLRHPDWRTSSPCTRRSRALAMPGRSSSLTTLPFPYRHAMDEAHAGGQDSGCRVCGGPVLRGRRACKHRPLLPQRPAGGKIASGLAPAMLGLGLAGQEQGDCRSAFVTPDVAWACLPACLGQPPCPCPMCRAGG